MDVSRPIAEHEGHGLQHEHCIGGVRGNTVRRRLFEYLNVDRVFGLKSESNEGWGVEMAARAEGCG